MRRSGRPRRLRPKAPRRRAGLRAAGSRAAAPRPAGLRAAAPRPPARRLPPRPASTPAPSADRRTAASTSQNRGEADRSPDARRPAPAPTRKTCRPTGDLPPPPMHTHSAWLLQELIGVARGIEPRVGGPTRTARFILRIDYRATGGDRPVLRTGSRTPPFGSSKPMALPASRRCAAPGAVGTSTPAPTTLDVQAEQC